MASDLWIRPARPDDRAAAERICADTWDWGDYIPEVWDAWLADEQGHLVVGELAGQVVALGKVTLQPGDQAWLEGMRVDPDYRRQGIAWQFFHHKLAYARAHGARVARLGTGDHNWAVHRMMERAGMERIGRYELLTAPALPESSQAGQPASPTLVQLAPQHAGQVLTFLHQSPVLARARGLYCLDWAWQEFSDSRAIELLASSQLIGHWSGAGSLEGLALVQEESDEERLWVGFVDPGPAAGPQSGPNLGRTEAFAHALRRHAHRCGCACAAAMLPDLPWLREAFRAAEYGYVEWEGELWIYEMALDSPPAAAEPAGQAPQSVVSIVAGAGNDSPAGAGAVGSKTPELETDT